MYGFMPLYRLRTLRPCVRLLPCPVPYPHCCFPRHEVPRHEVPKRKEAPYVHGLG
jgi:hypothetical protein